MKQLHTDRMTQLIKGDSFDLNYRSLIPHLYLYCDYYEPIAFRTPALPRSLEFKNGADHDSFECSSNLT